MATPLLPLVWLVEFSPAAGSACSPLDSDGSSQGGHAGLGSITPVIRKVQVHGTLQEATVYSIAVRGATLQTYVNS